MAEPQVANLPRKLPESVTVPEATDGMTPNEMRALKTASGRRLDELFGDAADLDDKTQAIVWIALRREGFEPSWNDAGDVQPKQADEPPDPTSAER